MSPNHRGIMTAACFAGYFLFGFVDNMKGATLPSVLEETGFGYAGGANIVLGEYAGFVLATLFTGILSDRFGKRFVMFLAGLLLLAGITGYAGSQRFAWFVATFFLVGTGCGALELGGSNIISGLYERGRGKFLSLLTCFHGIGSLLSPMVAAWAVGAGLGWRGAYRLSLVVVALFLLLMVFARDTGRQAEREERGDFREALRSVSTRRVALPFVIMFAYVATEIALSTWLTDFLVKEKGFSFAAGAAGLSLYFACIMGGRLAGSFFVDRIGHGRVLAACGAGATVMLALGIFGPARMAYALPLTGVFYSVIFPTATAAVSDLVDKNRGTVLGLLFCCGGVGGMAGPWLTGMLSDWGGPRVGMGVNAVFCLIIAVCAFLFQTPEREHGE